MYRVDKTRILKINLNKCHHVPAPVHRVITVDLASTTAQLFIQQHGEESSEYRVWTHDDGVDFDLEKDLSVSQITSLFPRFNNISFECNEVVGDLASGDDDDMTNFCDPLTPKKNAFMELMRSSRKRFFPAPKQSDSVNFNRKDELYNEVVSIFKNEGASFSSEEEASYCVSVLTNALWYITNHHMTINDACKQKNSIVPIPDIFSGLDGYNGVKRKKVKAVKLSSSDLNSHSQALFAMLLRPGKNTWKSMLKNVKMLAECLNSYKEYLDEASKRMNSIHLANSPARQLSEDTDIKYVPATEFVVDAKYHLIDAAVQKNGLHEPVIFDEDVHLSAAFTDRMQRFRFFENLQLSVPVDVIRFCPGGTTLTTTCISQTMTGRQPSKILSDGAKLLAKVRPELKEFHTRAQRRDFKSRVANVANVKPALLDIIYKELALDASTAAHPDTDTRINAMMLGASGLVADLRSLNPGRSGGTYDVFFETMGNYLNELTASDDRRHGGSQMSQWLSLRDLINQVTEKCPPNTPIPSKTLVRLQFTPSNPYTRQALSFTSRFPLQHKIQRRQLRAKHPDDHYCAAQYKYLRCRAVEEGGNAMFFSCDDKSKIHVGEPEAPVSTGVRGKTSITTKDNTLEALDHDLYKSSLTPNVVLKIMVPEAPDKSFVRGQVYYTVSDSVFQSSNPFRHAVMLLNIYKLLLDMPTTLLKYTDGGTDTRNTLEAVKIANICLFKELNLDMIIAGRCAPGHSFTNPAERIMSILNLGIQNVATERSKGGDEFEKLIKSCKSMADIRDKNTGTPGIREGWSESVKPVQDLVSDRFSRLCLKEQNFVAVPTVSDDEINRLKKYITALFPGMDPNKLQKAHTSKIPAYNEWKRMHCRETHYTFQVRKCADINCCSPPSRPAETLRWLPTPVLEDDDGTHYKPYDDVKGPQVTSDDHRPSLLTTKKTKNDPSTKVKATAVPAQEPSTSEKNVTEKIDFSLSAQTARASVTCVECRKPRIVYCKTKLDFRHKVMLARNISSFEFSCGSELFPPGEKRKLAKAMVIRPRMSCGDQVEVPYYGHNDTVDRKDLCSHCGASNSVQSAVLKKCFKTVLPMCDLCEKEGKKAFTQRPFGKGK